jgi:hypothetical protein
MRGEALAVAGSRLPDLDGAHTTHGGQVLTRTHKDITS